MRKVLLSVVIAGALAVATSSATSCSSGGTGGGTGGGSGGGAAGGTAGGAAGGREMADADAGLCDAGVLATCTSYDDRSAPDAGRTVEFGTVNPLAAVPQCMQIKAGQTITINAGAFHPAVQDCGPVNRKVTAPDSAMTKIRLDVPGDYGYHCDIHFFTGFIKVTP